MAKKPKKQRKRPPKPAKRKPIVVAGVVILMLAFFTFFGLSMFSNSGTSSSSNQPVQAKKVDWEVVNSYPHDPDAFLQGLVWFNNSFYESTGRNGKSSLRHVEFPSGNILKKFDLPPQYFGEGLAMVGDKLFQLTWTSKKAFVYDRETFNLLHEYTYNTEGWGLTYDGKYLILSDGSSTLTYYDPDNFHPIKKLNVTNNGSPVLRLNELEYINGEIWSNIWQTDQIVRINPDTGQVTSYLDMTGLLTREFRTGREDVLNGIAYDPQTKRIFVSGKLWPRIFEIKLK
ncbi:MAG TPA: glutaminyl-peptide cyclotransferase [Blastocatellia bacterium]|nr:glutaminyl-peptide cyclotransferase [Blastocatellia bacterium]